MDELRTRLHWLMGLRVVVVTLLLGLSLAFQATRGERAPTFYGLIIRHFHRPEVSRHPGKISGVRDLLVTQELSPSTVGCIG